MISVTEANGKGDWVVSGTSIDGVTTDLVTLSQEQVDAAKARYGANWPDEFFPDLIRKLD